MCVCVGGARWDDKRRSSRERHILTRLRVDTGLSTNWTPAHWEAERILLGPPDTHWNNGVHWDLAQVCCQIL